MFNKILSFPLSFFQCHKNDNDFCIDTLKNSRKKEPYYPKSRPSLKCASENEDLLEEEEKKFIQIIHIFYQF